MITPREASFRRVGVGSWRVERWLHLEFCSQGVVWGPVFPVPEHLNSQVLKLDKD